jgi:surface antigen
MRLMTILLLLMAFFHTVSARALYEGLQCVPYARALTGVEIRGDAHTWWSQAEGRYDRGRKPKVGSVMSFRPHGNMRLGHVAAVRQIIDSRTLIISHANWSTIDGQRGHIEENVKVVDASEAGDWSAVQVWYTPNQALGTTRWPLNGFIYPDRQRSDNAARMALAQILGPKAQVAPTWKQAAREVRTAAYTPPVKAGTFQLSSKTLAEVNKKAANETRVAWAAPAKTDRIGELIATKGR